MTQQQIKWASQHDWFINANYNTVTVIDTQTGEIESFTDFKTLYNWAGY